MVSKIWDHFPSHPYGNHINLGLHQHYSCDWVSAGPERRASERPGSPWNGWLTLNDASLHHRGVSACIPARRPPSEDLSFFLRPSLFSLSRAHSAIFPFFIWSLKPRNCGLHPPFFQSPLKFIGFSGGLPVLPPRGNRDQSIHYLDRDGCRSPCTVPITRTSKGGSPLFSA